MIGLLIDLIGVLVIGLGITCGAIIAEGFWNGII